MRLNLLHASGPPPPSCGAPHLIHCGAPSCIWAPQLRVGPHSYLRAPGGPLNYAVSVVVSREVMRRLLLLLPLLVLLLLLLVLVLVLLLQG